MIEGPDSGVQDSSISSLAERFPFQNKTFHVGNLSITDHLIRSRRVAYGAQPRCGQASYAANRTLQKYGSRNLQSTVQYGTIQKAKL